MSAPPPPRGGGALRRHVAPGARRTGTHRSPGGSGTAPPPPDPLGIPRSPAPPFSFLPPRAPRCSLATPPRDPGVPLKNGGAAPPAVPAALPSPGGGRNTTTGSGSDAPRAPPGHGVIPHHAAWPAGWAATGPGGGGGHGTRSVPVLPGQSPVWGLVPWMRLREPTGGLTPGSTPATASSTHPGPPTAGWPLVPGQPGRGMAAGHRCRAPPDESSLSHPSL